jgi:hypothetical protein
LVNNSLIIQKIFHIFLIYFLLILDFAKSSELSFYGRKTKKFSNQFECPVDEFRQ